MPPSETRLFHLHYHVPDIDYAERVLSEQGLPLHTKLGLVDGEMVTFQPDEKIPEEVRFRLQDSQRGYANVTLTAGKRVQFEHIGIITTKFDSILNRAEEAGWYIHGLDKLRTFLTTPWGFRIEIHPEGNQVEESLGSWEDARFAEIVLTVSDAEAVRKGINSVIGSIPGLTIRNKTHERPQVPQATLTGREFPEEQTIQAELLESTTGT